MSHITQLATQIKDLTLLGKIAKKHGYALTIEKSKIQGVGRSSVDATLNIQGSQGIAVGFQKEAKSGAYSMVADMWGVNSKDRKFLDSLTQEYGVEIAKQELMKQGYNVSNIKTLADGSIGIVLER